MTPAELTALVDVMRAKGVRKLKTADVEIDLGPPPPGPSKFNLEEHEDDGEVRKKRLQGYVYGSSY